MTDLASDVRYSKNPSLHYLAISNNEILVKGSHLEGFSLVIDDAEGRGIVSRILEFVSTPASVSEICAALSPSAEVDESQLEAFLQQLVASGALLAAQDNSSQLGAWLSFLRYGHVEPAAQRHPLILVGSDLAKRLADSIVDLGYEHISLLPEVAALEFEDLVPLEPGADPTGDLDDSRGRLSDQSDIPDDSSPRVIVVSGGSSLSDLYRINEKAVAAGVPILYCQAAGADYVVGPYVAPGSTACFWEYERQRARGLFSYSDYAILVGAGSTAALPQLTAQASVAAFLPYGIELATIGRSSVAGQVVCGKATTAETRRSSIMRLPRCPVCLAQRPLLRNLLI